MKSKQKKVLIIIIILIIIGIFIRQIYFMPKPLVNELDEVLLNQIRYNDKKNIQELEDVTSKFKHEDVVSLLRDFESKATLRSVPSEILNEEKITVEINVTRNSKPMHILLGDYYICYASVGGNVREILNGGDLLEKMIELLEE